MGFDNIFCIIKLSELDYHEVLGGGSERILKLDQAKRKELTESHLNQQAFVQELKEQSTSLGLDIQFVPQLEIKTIAPGPRDLVITAGGDGTFLNAAQHFGSCCMLGMNNDYKPTSGVGSYGALTCVNRDTLKKRLKDLSRGRYQIVKWSRLQVKINGKLVERLAINDIYFGQRISYRTCDLIIEQSGQTEQFNCSGLLLCTGMGSHAWHYNAGGSPFSNELEAFGFRVLIPNLKRPLHFTSGILQDGQEVIVTPERDGYILSFDSSTDEIATEMGDDIRISIAPEGAIRVLSFET
ncbi:MAG: hypothetical protein QNL04_12180 [SAR324 cluster bacterium]|nr:hypothetical protein [SAR324 cluster bacterium]